MGINSYMYANVGTTLFNSLFPNYTNTFVGPEYTIFEYPHALNITEGANSTSSNKNIQVEVLDNYGNSHNINTPVYFDIIGGGSLSVDQSNETNGAANTSWTLGNGATQRITAKVKKGNGDNITNATEEYVVTGSGTGNTGNGSSTNAPTLHTGLIWNMDGANHGAWDLMNHQGVYLSGSNSIKDLANTTPIGTAAPDFYEEFQALNSTKYVAGTLTDYTNLDYSGIQSKYTVSYTHLTLPTTPYV